MSIHMNRGTSYPELWKAAWGRRDRRGWGGDPSPEAWVLTSETGDQESGKITWLLGGEAGSVG